MTAPRTKAALEAEVATWTEEISNGGHERPHQGGADPASHNQPQLSHSYSRLQRGRSNIFHGHSPSVAGEWRRIVSLLHEIIEKALLTRYASIMFTLIRSRLEVSRRQYGQRVSRGGRTPFIKSNSGKIGEERLQKVLGRTLISRHTATRMILRRCEGSSGGRRDVEMSAA